MQLVNAMAINNSIKTVYLYDTDLVVMGNIEQWGVALTTNKTLKKLGFKGVKSEVVEKLKEITKDRTTQLTIMSE